MHSSRFVAVLSPRTLPLAIASIILATSTVALAVTGIPGPDDLIHACFNTNTGTLRAIAFGMACSNPETPIAWPTSTYVDNAVAAEAVARTAADAAEAGARQQGDVATLAAANLYTDQKLVGSSSTTYVDQGDASTLAAAKQYADQRDAATLATAGQYTDAKVAAAASTAYSKRINCCIKVPTINHGAPVLIAQVTLPPGTYLVVADLTFENLANYGLQDNSRDVTCDLGVPAYAYMSGFGDRQSRASMSMHFVHRATITQTLELRCSELYGGATPDVNVSFGWISAVSFDTYVAIP